VRDYSAVWTYDRGAACASLSGDGTVRADGGAAFACFAVSYGGAIRAFGDGTLRSAFAR
jgi:hypothetical protein